MGLTAGFQPTMVPSSVANRKAADADVGAGEPVLGLEKPLTLNPPVGPPSMLNTVPVGVPEAPNGSTGVGMLTTSGTMPIGAPLAPGVLYRVETPALLSEIQNGLPGLSAMPQGLTK